MYYGPYWGYIVIFNILVIVQGKDLVQFLYYLSFTVFPFLQEDCRRKSKTVKRKSLLSQYWNPYPYNSPLTNLTLIIKSPIMSLNNLIR